MTGQGDTTVKCLGCGRKLTAAASIARGRGPVCYAKLRLAAMAEAVRGFTAEQVAKIREALADGGAVLTSRPGVYRIVGSAKPLKDGEVAEPPVYLTSVDGHCNCPHGLHVKSATARPCYHVGIARVDAAARKAA